MSYTKRTIFWHEDNIQKLKDNAHEGFSFLVKLFGVSDGGVRSMAKKHKIKVPTEKEIKDIMMGKLKKDPITDAAYSIIETDLHGTSKVWIPSEKIQVTIPSTKDIQECVNKIAFRHKELSKF